MWEADQEAQQRDVFFRCTARCTSGTFSTYKVTFDKHGSDARDGSMSAHFSQAIEDCGRFPREHNIDRGDIPEGCRVLHLHGFAGWRSFAVIRARLGEDGIRGNGESNRNDLFPEHQQHQDAPAEKRGRVRRRARRVLHGSVISFPFCSWLSSNHEGASCPAMHCTVWLCQALRCNCACRPWISLFL